MCGCSSGSVNAMQKGGDCVVFFPREPKGKEVCLLFLHSCPNSEHDGSGAKLI